MTESEFRNLKYGDVLSNHGGGECFVLGYRGDGSSIVYIELNTSLNTNLQEELAFLKEEHLQIAYKKAIKNNPENKYSNGHTISDNKYFRLLYRRVKNTKIARTLHKNKILEETKDYLKIDLT